jgi:hypothetical protein
VIGPLKRIGLPSGFFELYVCFRLLGRGEKIGYGDKMVTCHRCGGLMSEEKSTDLPFRLDFFGNEFAFINYPVFCEALRSIGKLFSGK